MADMSDIALEGLNVSKKFKKGELHDSLRDLIPALTGRLLKRKNAMELGIREFWALNDVSFEVHRGDSLGIIGHNGAGKSTLLKILCGIMKPTKGHISVRGRLSALIEVGAGFHQDLTGRENVYLNGTILGMTRQEINNKFDAIVSFSGLDDFIDTPVKRYSSGMYARLGFSVAAHINPEILLVDEVLSVGDWGFQKKCAEKMNQLAKSGVTIIFISHNLRAVTDLCPKTMLLDRGKVLRIGPSDEIVKYYLDHIASTTDQGFLTDVASSIRVSKVVLTKDGNEESRFSTGDRIIVRITITSEVDYNDLGLHVYLKDSDDYRLFYVYLELLETGAFSIRAGETKEIQVELNLHLGTGFYNMGVSICNRYATAKKYDDKYPIAKFYVEAEEAIRLATNLYPKVISNAG
jgi:lipopolysaccharide transport system ATP-binding protein